MPAVGGDHIGIDIIDHRRAVELSGQPVPEDAEDRPILPARARRRRPRGNPLGLAKQVPRLEPGRGRRGRGEDGGRNGPGALDELDVDDLALGICDPGERELQLAHRERLFPKLSMSGHVKPHLGRLQVLTPQAGEILLTFE